MKRLMKIGDFFAEICIVFGVILLLQQYVVGQGMVDGISMESTLVDNQRVLVDKITYKFSKPNRFDIVAVKFPAEDNHWVKRVIGLPGELIEYRGNKLYVNGEYVAEDFLDSTTITSTFSTKSLFPETKGVIPEGKYLILGDNRARSKDSRFVGAIDIKDIDGVVRVSIYPFDRFGLL